MRGLNRHIIQSFCILFLATNILWAYAGTVTADASAGKVDRPSVNVRSAPGTENALVGTLEQGHLVQIISKQGDWSQIVSDKISGWIRSDLLAAAPDAVWLIVILESCNLRSGPGTEYDMLDKAQKDDRLLMIGQTGDWYQGITEAGKIVYVRSDLVRTADDSGNPVVPPSASAPSTPQVSNDSPQTANLASAGSDVKVYVNSKLLTFDVAPRIEESRVLVPVRAIFEAVGARVDYDKATRTVYAYRGSHTVVMPIDSKCPIVDGKICQIDVPARIVEDRTLVPLRFAAEALGGKVDWEKATRSARIEIPDENPTPDPDPGSNPDDDPVTPPPTEPQVNQSLGMTVEKDYDGLSIYMAADIAINPEVSQGSNRITYTFRNINISGSSSIDETLGGYGTLQARARNDGKNAIIEVSWPAGIKYVSEPLSNGTGYEFRVGNFITSIEQESYGTVGERLVVSTLCPMQYTSSQNGNVAQVIINNVSRGQAQSSYSFASSLISGVSVADGGSSTTVVASTRNVGRMSFVEGETGEDSLCIVLIDKSKIWSPGSSSGIVVLDPGHGGREVGSSGSLCGEKDLNLAISLKVRDILVKKGVAVEMTRDGDDTMSLDDRPDVANAINAALFVSIHNNWWEDPAVNGTETYFYAPIERPELYAQREEREALATVIQTNAISCLGSNNRGVKENNLAVLRLAKMPSALIEVGFVTNSAEQDLLLNDAYQQKAAQAIANGILQYMGK